MEELPNGKSGVAVHLEMTMNYSGSSASGSFTHAWSRRPFLLDNFAAHVHRGWLRRRSADQFGGAEANLLTYDQGPAVFPRSLL